MGAPRKRIARRPCPECGDPSAHIHPDGVPQEIRDARTTPVPIALPMQETKQFPVVDMEVDEPGDEIAAAFDRVTVRR